jgi:hypothetical protein
MATAKAYDWKIARTLNACKECGIFTAKQKKITKSGLKGARLYENDSTSALG